MLQATKSTVTKRQKYTAAWGAIKTDGKLELTVQVHHAAAVEYGILRAKSRENTANRRLGLGGFPKLWITRTPVSAELVKLSFTLSHDDRLL
jgi:hypothetical protein